MKNDGMRGDLGKRVMIVALAACLALLVFLFARRSVDSEMAFDEEYPRKNLGIGLVLEEDDRLVLTCSALLDVLTDGELTVSAESAPSAQ